MTRWCAFAVFGLAVISVATAAGVEIPTMAAAISEGGAHPFEWRSGLKLVGWTLATAVLLLGARHFSRRWIATLRARELEEEEEWTLEERYPYCTEPPEDDPIVFDLHEPIELSLPLLRQLEWRRFEELVCGYFETQGFEAQSTRVGRVTGVDVYLYRPGEHRPAACVQAKSLIDREGVRRWLRELRAAMTTESVDQGLFVTASTLRPDVAASGAGIEVVDGPELVARFGDLRVEDRDRILRHVLRGDYRTPTCPNCGAKMVAEMREGRSLWRCANYPRCQRQMTVRPSA